MKKRKGSRVVNVLKRIINIRAWVDFDRVKSFTTYLASGFKRLFVPQKQAQGETFTEAMARLNLSEQDLKARQAALYRLSVLMCGAALFIFLYAVYQLIFGGIKAVVISVVVMLIALALAFRYHFWYFQIKERKLGCSLQEWYKRGLRGEE